MRLTALLLAAASVLATFGCSAPEPSEGELVAASADELATSGPTYEVGTALRTTANLNLRSSPSTTASVLRVMPSGSQVTVRQRSGADAWVAVSFSGYSGWAHTSYLTRASGGASAGGGNDDAPPAPGANGYSAARGSKLATTARRVDGRASGGYCAREMSTSVERSGIIPAGVTWYRNHAIVISEYMASNSAYSARVGFKRVSVGPSAIPKGSIIGWRRGQCGYNSSYGHIEIAVDDSSSRACSDFCGSIKKSCGNPYVFVPTTL